MGHLQIRHWIGTLGVIAQERLQREKLKRTLDLIVEEYEKLVDLLLKDRDVFLQYDDESFDQLVIPIDTLLPQQYSWCEKVFERMTHSHPNFPSQP